MSSYKGLLKPVSWAVVESKLVKEQRSHCRNRQYFIHSENAPFVYTLACQVRPIIGS